MSRSQRLIVDVATENGDVDVRPGTEETLGQAARRWLESTRREQGLAMELPLDAADQIAAVCNLAKLRPERPTVGRPAKTAKREGS